MSNNIFSPEIEEKFLATILRNSEYADVCGVLPEMLSSIQNRILLSIIREINSKGYIDKAILLEYLRSKNLLDNVGGDGYIQHLYTVDYNLDDLQRYCDLILTSYKIRALLQVGGKLKKENLDHGNINSVISNTIKFLEDLISVGSDEMTQDLYSALKLSWKEIQAKIENGGNIGIPFGVEKIDSVVGGIAKGDLWIIGARPSMGKTALMCNSALETAKRGTRVLILSLEMSRQAIIERMLAIETGIPVFNIRLGILDQKDIDKIADTMNSMKNLPILINSKFVPDLSYVESIIRSKKSTDNIDIVYLDYIQLLTGRDDDSTQELGRISQKMKMLARDLDLSICMLSQLSREVEKRPNKRPIMSDLRQSGYLEEDADLLAFLYRDDVYNQNSEFKNIMEFIIRKQRNGSIGTIPLTFDIETNKIY